MASKLHIMRADRKANVTIKLTDTAPGKVDVSFILEPAPKPGEELTTAQDIGFFLFECIQQVLDGDITVERQEKEESHTCDCGSSHSCSKR